MKEVYICDNCGDEIDDWQTPDKGYWQLNGRKLCRFCYEEEVEDYVKEKA